MSANVTVSLHVLKLTPRLLLSQILFIVELKPLRDSQSIYSCQRVLETERSVHLEGKAGAEHCRQHGVVALEDSTTERKVSY